METPTEKLNSLEVKPTPEAREVLVLFQRAVQAVDEKERLALLEEFKKKLVDLLEPKKHRIAEMQPIPRVLRTGEKLGFGDNYMFVGGGTGGQRIYFEDYIIVRDPEKAERLGEDALREESRDGIELKSRDGKPRWMTYHKPEGGDWHFGEKYWNKYIEIFGDQTVDLLQKLQENDK